MNPGRVREALRQAPTADLLAELRWRMEQGEASSAAIALRGVAVDPVAGRILFRGREHRLSGRYLEVVYALAVAHHQGRPWVRTDRLAHKVWRGFDLASALTSCRSAVCVVRQRVPGLILSDGAGGTYGHYRLAYDPAALQRPALGQGAAEAVPA